MGGEGLGDRAGMMGGEGLRERRHVAGVMGGEVRG